MRSWVYWVHSVVGMKGPLITIGRSGGLLWRVDRSTSSRRGSALCERCLDEGGGLLVGGTEAMWGVGATWGA